MFRAAVAIPVLLLVACAPKVGPATQPERKAAVSSGPDVSYYRGLSKVTPAGGQLIGTIDLLFKRTVDPERSMIIEQTVQKSSKQGEKPTEYTSSMKVVGNRFTAVESTLGIKSEGELTGEPWKWNAWTSRATLTDGSTVESSFTRDAGGLKADKQIFGPLGVLRVTLSETYAPITADSFEQERREMLGLPSESPDAGTAPGSPR